MTIDDWGIIKVIVENNGYYPGDPQAYEIARYTNDWGRCSYIVSMAALDARESRYSPYVHNYEILWNRRDGPTQTFKQELEEQEQKLKSKKRGA